MNTYSLLEQIQNKLDYNSKHLEASQGQTLTLIGMRGDTFISLSFLDRILSADSKITILFWR